MEFQQDMLCKEDVVPNQASLYHFIADAAKPVAGQKDIRIQNDSHFSIRKKSSSESDPAAWASFLIPAASSRNR